MIRSTRLSKSLVDSSSSPMFALFSLFMDVSICRTHEVALEEGTKSPSHCRNTLISVELPLHPFEAMVTPYERLLCVKRRPQYDRYSQSTATIYTREFESHAREDHTIFIVRVQINQYRRGRRTDGHRFLPRGSCCLLMVLRNSRTTVHKKNPIFPY